ncbi:dipeptide epimerase [Kaistia dalseonensis]|uniref:Dipeptide epimerase n=1 Tax=Kaistia dalseonensis TaxID=410840 RepID=A0ABU0H2J3_9HYPH|nr:N-acetyl-D-Glu racemase DgcA [Kaistia dalseonensis]MCX5493548.1 dipeptide epimerase [Kaistia dalseonensis]MDQ0436108.1 L-alanine-DL-glutamate epimerase-like enolase superfamily enzyme [Kaistia dalseonensis]
MSPILSVGMERWPIAGAFVISRGARTEATVVVATISDGADIGRGECVPYARYGETVEGVVAAIEAVAPAIAAGMDRATLMAEMPPGAARNAIDCALWDLEAKRTGVSVAARLGLSLPHPLVTAYTLSLGTPESMEAAARIAAERPLLKVKLGGAGDIERIAAVRRGAPTARIVVDANEAWSTADFDAHMRACRDAGVELIEQPLPAGHDDWLASAKRLVPVCADESLHVASDLDELAGRYDAINVKLDKTGGLTEALELVAAARAHGFAVMVGCMVGTSLAMAPAVLLAQEADFVDLDGPLLLARDREPGLLYRGSLVSPPEPALWG